MAQVDTTKIKTNTTSEYYDVVAVYREHIDGRGRRIQFTTELKGEIMNYDATTGLITFKALDGKMYSLKSGDYKYFQYNKEFPVKHKTTVNRVLKPRKESEWQISVGPRITALDWRDNFIPDDYYVWSQEGLSDVPIALYAGLGKYFTRKHFVGVGGELAFSSFGKNYINAGLRYAYQYDANKHNTALYIPIELNYFSATYSQPFDVADTTFTYYPGGGYSWSYPSQKSVNLQITALSFSIGQGIAFITNNKHSIALEVSVLKLFPINTSFPDEPARLPDIKMSGLGFKFNLLYNF